MGAKSKKKHQLQFTTQRVDHESLAKIKTINYHIYKNKGLNLSQWEIIKHAIEYAYAEEADFIEYIISGKITPDESAFDTLVRITGKPWFPYGNLVKVD